MKTNKILVFIISTMIILCSTGCAKKVGDNFTEYRNTYGAIGVVVQSDSSFVQNEDIRFTWVLENVSDETINYEGTPFVELYLVENNSDYIPGNPDAYEEYILSGDFETGKINEGIKTYSNLRKGNYTLEIKVLWLNVNGSQ
ncbi:MAG: hypothetical protein J7L77_05535, partial [Clostridiales bacterium]|nr:hypothetical protein [Clostridiales bacterium]